MLAWVRRVGGLDLFSTPATLLVYVLAAAAAAADDGDGGGGEEAETPLRDIDPDERHLFAVL